MKTLLAQVISRLFGPESTMPLFFLVVLVVSGVFTLTQTTTLLPALILLDALAPIVAILTLFKLGRISDLDVSRREQRPFILSIVVISYLLAALSSYLAGNLLIFKLHLILMALTAVFTLVTLRYKISFHTGGNTAFFILINHLFGWRFWWIFVLLLPIAWARYFLKKHTLAQLLWGIVLALVVVLTGVQVLL